MITVIAGHGKGGRRWLVMAPPRLRSPHGQERVRWTDYEQSRGSSSSTLDRP